MPSGPSPNARRVPGVDLHPLRSLDDGTWAEGTHSASGTRVLVRFVDGVPFADAFQAIGELLAVIEAPPAGVVPPKGVAVLTPGGQVVAASFAADAGFEIGRDTAAAASIGPDAPVDVVIFWDTAGEECLSGVRHDPQAGSQRLVDAAALLDRLLSGAGNGLDGAGHGALDGPCLRVIDGAPRVLGTAMARLAAARRGRLDRIGPWHVVPAECCLPPGEPGSRSDQYALAVLWAHARTGKPPFREGEAGEIVRTKLASAPPLADLPGGERAVVSRALSPSADQRYASCAEFAAALAAAVEPTPAASPSPQPPSAAPQPGESMPRSVVTAPRTEPEAPPSPRPSEPTTPSVIDTESDGLEETKRQPAPASDPVHARPATPPSAPAPRLPDVAGTSVTAAVAPGTGAYGGPLAAYPYKPGDVIVPGYRLVKTLGKGGFGEVWRASAPGGMSVAIKVIAHLGREGAKEYRAIQTVKDIHHAHIVPMVGVWLKGPKGHLLDDDETRRVEDLLCASQRPSTSATVDLGSVPAPDQLELVIAMGLGEQTLAQRLEDRKALLGPGYEGLRGIEPAQLLTWMGQAAMAIDHFNRGAGRGGASPADVQHCDIKPHNMLLVGNAVQVCDFGLARVQGEVRATVNNHLSVAYAAPEMTSKPHQPSPTTDQYSLAVTYHELRTGLLPYAGQTGRNPDEFLVVAILEAKRAGDLDLSLLGPAERRVLEKAMSIVPAERYGSCEAMVDALGIALEQDERSPPAGAAAAKDAKRKTSPTKLSGLVGLAAGGTVVAGLVGFLLFSSAAGGAKRQIEQARALIGKAVADEGELKVDTLDAAEKLLEKVDRRKHKEAATLLDSLAVAREVIDLDDEAGLEEVEAARRKVDDARSDFPGALAQALDRLLTERLANARAAGEATEMAAAVAALEANPEPSAAAIETLEERIESGTSLEASARKSLQTRIGAVRERQVEAIISEARAALAAAVPDGLSPIDRAALEKAAATATRAEAYGLADVSQAVSLRGAVDAILALAAVLADGKRTPVERAGELHGAVSQVFRVDGAVPSEIQTHLERRVGATLEAIHEAVKDQDVDGKVTEENQAVVGSLVQTIEVLMRTKGGKTLAPEVLNYCATALAQRKGVDEEVGKQAVALVNLALANHREAGEPTDEKSVTKRMIFELTLVEALRKGGNTAAADAEWARAMAELKTLTISPKLKQYLLQKFEEIKAGFRGD